MRSMTGFGAAAAPVGSDEVRVEIKSVNHRFLDVKVRAPGGLADHASAAEALVRRRLSRGRVELHLRLERSGERPIYLDEARARSAFASLAALRDELTPGADIPLSLLSAVPNLFRSDPQSKADDLGEAVLQATEEALNGLASMRSTEGAQLMADVSGHLESFDASFGEIVKAAPGVVKERQEKLRARIAELMTDTDANPDSGRLEHEIAVLAEKLDIAEELSRLRAHIETMGTLLRETDKPVGRKLDFLLQEMGRETNTIGSKVPNVDLTSVVIELKACLERMREQVQNVE